MLYVAYASTLFTPALTAGTLVLHAMRTIGSFRVSQLLVLLLLAIQSGAFGTDTEATVAKRVLVIHSYGMDFKWTMDMDRGIREVLETAPDTDTTVHSETLDAKYFNGDVYMAGAADFIRQKYESWSFEAIIVTDNFALEFMGRYGRGLWPETPVVFCGINNYTPNLLNGMKNVTGVSEGLSASETIAVIRRLFPGWRRFHILADDTVTGRENVRIVRRALSSYEVDVTVHRPLTPESLSSLGRGTGRGDIAILVGLVWDQTLTPLDFQRSGKLVSRLLDIPVFSLWDFYMNTGIAGGYMSSGMQQGREAARLAQRILDGEEAEEIPVVRESPNVPVFDMAVLGDFGIATGRLPENSVIYNEPVGLWDKYRGEIFFVLSAFLLLVSLTLVAYETARRRGARAEATAATLREKETLLREIHHRVKNNLQVVSSLLSIQSNVLRDEEVLSHFQDARTRIQSMALVHEHLYESSSLARIDTREYVDDLVSTVIGSMDLSGGRINVTSSVAELPLDIDHAIPLGLIINELLSNALKYACPERNGTVRLSLEQRGRSVFLEIADDGPGIPGDATARQGSLGLQLVEALAGQLNGSLRFENTEPGLAVHVSFPFIPQAKG